MKRKSRGKTMQGFKLVGCFLHRRPRQKRGRSGNSHLQGRGGQPVPHPPRREVMLRPINHKPAEERGSQRVVLLNTKVPTSSQHSTVKGKSERGGPYVHNPCSISVPGYLQVSERERPPANKFSSSSTATSTSSNIFGGISMSTIAKNQHSRKGYLRKPLPENPAKISRNNESRYFEKTFKVPYSVSSPAADRVIRDPEEFEYYEKYPSFRPATRIDENPYDEDFEKKEMKEKRFDNFVDSYFSRSNLSASTSRVNEDPYDEDLMKKEMKEKRFDNFVDPYFSGSNLSASATRFNEDPYDEDFVREMKSEYFDNYVVSPNFSESRFSETTTRSKENAYEKDLGKKEMKDEVFDNFVVDPSYSRSRFYEATARINEYPYEKDWLKKEKKEEFFENFVVDPNLGSKFSTEGPTSHSPHPSSQRSHEVPSSYFSETSCSYFGDANAFQIEMERSEPMADSDYFETSTIRPPSYLHNQYPHLEFYNPSQNSSGEWDPYGDRHNKFLTSAGLKVNFEKGYLNN